MGTQWYKEADEINDKGQLVEPPQTVARFSRGFLIGHMMEALQGKSEDGILNSISALTISRKVPLS
ncbi:hypothetical protein DVH24_037566 [Malus domestica]|uniref:Uncharacterized protein n=1 Tax=Malus domestica TaxID=3750 RepID=A0A498J393_MALDO|nr:hypothetical protein DVH24_037566 [Malus domestica]